MLKRKKKLWIILANVCLIFVFLFSTISFCNENIITENTTSFLVEYDLKTKETTNRNYPTSKVRSGITHTEGYIPSNVMPKTREIIGSDSRTDISNTEVYPYSTICYLEITYQDGTIGRGTAFLIYSNYAYTAGHNVINQSHGYATSIRVVPGKNGNTEPFGEAWVTSFEYDNTWASDFKEEEDWAFLTLNSHIGNTTGWMPIACSDDYTYFETENIVLSVIGYPRATYYGYKQYIGSGTVVKANGMHLIYNIDTETGQSGGPVIQGNYAIGIHISWTMVDNVLYNQCANITRARFEGFISKIN